MLIRYDGDDIQTLNLQFTDSNNGDESPFTLPYNIGSTEDRDGFYTLKSISNGDNFSSEMIITLNK